jgi:hypothetical protein
MKSKHGERNSKMKTENKLKPKTENQNPKHQHLAMSFKKAGAASAMVSFCFVVAPTRCRISV